MAKAVYPQEQLMPRVLELAAHIAANAPVLVRRAKKAILHALQVDLTNGLILKFQAYGPIISTADRREGLCAFNEKGRPAFTGR